LSIVTVPSNAFGGTDADGGIITAIRITSFPTNVTSITINNVNYSTLAAIQAAYPNGIPTNSSGQPSVPITVDPVNGNVNVVISYATIDNAGKEDPTPGSVTLPFVSVDISGNVFNDVNGLTNNIVDGTGTGLPSGTQLYANLLDAAGTTVIATVPVNADGTYQFTGVPGNTTYNVQISTNQGTPTQPTPVTTLPTNWVNTGENLGAGTGNDGTVNGLLPVTVTNINVTNANFGIEQLPNSGTNTQPLQPNPVGTASANVPASAFSGTDPDMGIISAIKITSFPTNANSITINGVTYTAANFTVGGVTVPTNATGQPTQTIAVDPVDGNVTVTISYATIDNAGKEDPTPGSVALPFSNISLAGNVFNDLNGLNSGGNVDGAGIGLADGSRLYANLLDATGTTVIATVPINNDGTYSFYGIASNTNYTVQLSINQGTAGQPAPVTTLPTGWFNTGEDCCDNMGSDGTINGLVNVMVGTSDVTNVNFGIDKQPAGVDITAPAQLNPGGTIQVAVPPLNGTDPEEGNLTSGFTVRIDVVPTNATLYYDADGPGGNAPVAITNGTVITNYNPAYLTIDPNPNDASQPALLATFTYSIADQAGIYDPVPNTVNMQFLQPVAITGTVYYDANGSANNTHQNIQNGAEVGTNANNTLYAYIVNPSTGAIIAKDTVNADGTWSFNGLPAAGTVKVVITTDNQSIGAANPALTLPTGWTNTSPLDTTIVYNNPPGFLITNVNYGIEEVPESFSSTQPLQINPGGTNNAVIQPEAFYGEDKLDGMVMAIRITSMPTNTTSITINGTTYTSANFPMGGITIPTDPNGQPLQTIAVDPVDGNVTVEITYTTIDNANREDPTPAVVDIPFSLILSLDNIVLEGNYNGNGSKLIWKVTNESNISTYIIERSYDAVNYESLSTINALNNRLQQYSFIDMLTGFTATNAYYRVKVIESNGRSYYSNVLRMALTEIRFVQVSPNPFVNYINIQMYSEADADATIRLIASNGSVVLQRKAALLRGNSTIQVQTDASIPSGLYWLEVKTIKRNIVYKMIK
jgi:hypothetical protein